MLANDKEVYEYYAEVKPLPFLCGVQGEGRRWTSTFSQEALGIFDYLFTDAMTIRDHKNRNSRIYRAEEVHYDDLTKEQYMDIIVEQTVKILTNEPADIFANPTFIPDEMNVDYDKYWTDERIAKVLDVLERHDIALEINPRYKIPSLKIINLAKERGLKFTFGTNNVDANFGKLEYCIEAIEKCGITADDIWFPSMSTRRTRPVVIYNKD
jgi:histidinol phosphatase-like PHP family hydrolase